MIRTFTVMNNFKLINIIPLRRLADSDNKWCWVDLIHLLKKKHCC